MYYFNYRVKTTISSKYGLSSQPRLVDIIAAVPQQYRKVSIDVMIVNYEFLPSG